MAGGVRGAAQTLWTPDGFVGIREKQVIPINLPILRMLSWLHEWAANMEINIFCKRCEKAIRGQNNDSSKTFSVSCECREWKFIR